MMENKQEMRKVFCETLVELAKTDSRIDRKSVV